LHEKTSANAGKQKDGFGLKTLHLKLDSVGLLQDDLGIPISDPELFPLSDISHQMDGAVVFVGKKRGAGYGVPVALDE